MVDCIVELPLPGRTFCHSTARSAAGAAPFTMPAWIGGPENDLLVGAIRRLLPQETRCEPEINDESRPAPPAIVAIHGTSGTGKTHLARGLVERWQECFGAESAAYYSAADFRRELSDAIQGHTVPEFRRRVRGRPLLVIDDLDRLPDHDYLQQELRYTIDACSESGGLIVVTSSRPAPVLRNLSVDVRRRLAAGLLVAVTPPDYAARKRLLLEASGLLGPRLSEEAASRLATAIAGTANDLFGALFALYADRSDQTTDDVTLVARFLDRRQAQRPSMRAILRLVAKYYHVPQQLLKSSSRRQSIVLARAMAVYLARELAGLSYERIGRELGGRDHTTIIHNYRKISQHLKRHHATREAVDDLQRSLAVS